MEQLQLLGQRLRKLRQNAGFKAPDAERLAGLGNGLLTRFESGMAEPYLEEASRLADVYGTSLASMTKLLPDVPNTLPEDLNGAPRKLGWSRPLLGVGVAALAVLCFVAGKGWEYGGVGSEDMTYEQLVEHSMRDREVHEETAILVSLSIKLKNGLEALGSHGKRNDKTGEGARIAITHRFKQLCKTMKEYLDQPVPDHAKLKTQVAKLVKPLAE